MPWSAVISSDDVVAIHAILVPTADGAGEILLFGGDDHDHAANVAGRWDHSRRFNCALPTQPLVYVASPNVDLFCSGHACTGGGQLLVAGGTHTFPPESEGPHAHLHFEGHRSAFIYNVGAFTRVASMGGGRWYPTLCTLWTGEVLAVGGHPDGDDARHNNNTPERYMPLADRWAMLPAVADESSPDLYPRLHVLRDGWVFVSSALQGNARCVSIQPWSGGLRDVCALPDDAYRAYGCPSVLLPLTPADGYRSRVLLCGGVTPQEIDLGDPVPAWKATGPRSGTAAGRGRTNACATILPTGNVLVTGGADPRDDQAGVMEPELYFPPFDHTVNAPSYGAGPGIWRTIDEPAHVLRNYHSTALLMPDGRVWTGGGNNRDQPEQPPTADQKKIEIYDPPYAPGDRPTITDSPATLSWGQVFTIETPQALQIGQVTLLRCGSSTHAFNPDQRCIFLRSWPTAAGLLRVVAPPSGVVAPPGNYMLFILDKDGRPCQYARFVRVGRPFGFDSQHNIQNVGTAARPALAQFQGGLYMAWRGISEDDAIYWSRFDGGTWSPQRRVDGAGISAGPALAESGGRLYMAWRGVPGDDGIYWSTFSGSGWSPQQNVSGVGSTDGPALAGLGEILYMAWRGVPGDDAIYWSSFDGSIWSPQQVVSGAGTSSGPALAMWGSGEVVERLIMAWRGIVGDDGIYWSESFGSTWTPQQNVAGTGTSHGPRLAAFDNQLYMAWKSVPGDDRMYWNTYDGVWSPAQHLEGSGSSVGPALAAFHDHLYMAWPGVPGDDGIYFTSSID